MWLEFQCSIGSQYRTSKPSGAPRYVNRTRFTPYMKLLVLLILTLMAPVPGVPRHPAFVSFHTVAKFSPGPKSVPETEIKRPVVGPVLGVI
jgi:hypothetical protein